MFLAGLELDLDEFARQPAWRADVRGLHVHDPVRARHRGRGVVRLRARDGAALRLTLGVAHARRVSDRAGARPLRRSRGRDRGRRDGDDGHARALRARCRGGLGRERRTAVGVIVIEVAGRPRDPRAASAHSCCRGRRAACSPASASTVARAFSFVARRSDGGALVADRAGIEGIVGAFFAGLALNRLVPARSRLMEQIEFVGGVLLIPFFLLSTGMLIDPESVHGARACSRSRPLARRSCSSGSSTAALVSGRVLDPRPAASPTALRPLARAGGGDARGGHDRRRHRSLRHRSPERDARRRPRHCARVEHRHAERGPADRAAAGTGRAAGRDRVRAASTWSDDARASSSSRRAWRWPRAAPVLVGAVAPQAGRQLEAARERARRRGARCVGVGAEASSVVRVDASEAAALSAIVAEYGVTLVVTAGGGRGRRAIDSVLGGRASTCVALADVPVLACWPLGASGDGSSSPSTSDDLVGIPARARSRGRVRVGRSRRDARGRAGRRWPRTPTRYVRRPARRRRCRGRRGSAAAARRGGRARSRATTSSSFRRDAGRSPLHRDATTIAAIAGRVLGRGAGAAACRGAAGDGYDDARRQPSRSA